MIDLFPIRDKKHITETDSYKILNSALPKEWILRELTERDYGIDGIIEICDDGKMKGKIFAIQLKGNEYLSSTVENVKYYNVKAGTMNYWYNYPIPVLFFHADTTDERIYYTNIKQDIRDNFEAFTLGKYTTIKIPQTKQLTKQNALDILDSTYFYENIRENINKAITDFVYGFESNINNLNSHLEMDPGLGPVHGTIEYYQFFQNHNIIYLLGAFFLMNPDELGFDEVLRKCKEEWPDAESDLVCPIINDYIIKAQKFMKKLFNKEKNLLFNSSESYYWQYNHSEIIEYLLNFNENDLEYRSDYY